MFFDFFSSVYEPASPSDTVSNDIVISDLNFKKETILKELKLLDPAKGPGPDGYMQTFSYNIQ